MFMNFTFSKAKDKIQAEMFSNWYKESSATCKFTGFKEQADGRYENKYYIMFSLKSHSLIYQSNRFYIQN